MAAAQAQPQQRQRQRQRGRQAASDTVSAFRWLRGLCISSVFSLVYLITPLYILTCSFFVLLRVLQFFTTASTTATATTPSNTDSSSFSGSDVLFSLFVAPAVVSFCVPAIGMPWLANYMKPMLDYFDYEEILEISNEELSNKRTQEESKRYILALQPHGVISFVGLCAWVSTTSEFRRIPTATASAVLRTPILKHVMGIFGLTPASASNIKRILKRGGSVIIYIGGIAELFLSSRKEERLYLKNRKGFIKIALREGADVIPVYLFGNTSVLTVVKHGVLAKLSRKLQVSLTYFWGQWGLPLPRSNEKLVYCRGRPMGLPHIPNPTTADVDLWHDKYVQEVIKLFNSYKERLPAYKHKTLIVE